jgi:hypothetical protein
MDQITQNIMMIRPKHFGFNAETAENNSFQTNDESIDNETIRQLAVKEFDGFVELLQSKGIYVHVIEDTDTPIKPDAVFPNNWISFHEDGMVLTYPMYAKVRRIERRPDIIATLGEHYKIEKDYTLEHYEEEGLFLEGTGSLILDRQNKIAYANLSQRTDLQILEKWCILTNYEKIHFLAKDRSGADIYHTNVMMALGRTFVVICLDCVPDSKEKDLLIQTLEKTNKEIIKISLDQVGNFAGNMLQVKNNKGLPFLVMSSTAWNCLDEEQQGRINKHTDVIVGHIPTIERYGGGSVRCMMAEIFLPLK